MPMTSPPAKSSLIHGAGMRPEAFREILGGVGSSAGSPALAAAGLGTPGMRGFGGLNGSNLSSSGMGGGLEPHIQLGLTMSKMQDVTAFRVLTLSHGDSIGPGKAGQARRPIRIERC